MLWKVMEGSTAFFTTILVSAGLQLTATGVITHFDLESFPCSVQQGNLLELFFIAPALGLTVCRHCTCHLILLYRYSLLSFLGVILGWLTHELAISGSVCCSGGRLLAMGRSLHMIVCITFTRKSICASYLAPKAASHSS